MNSQKYCSTPPLHVVFSHLPLPYLRRKNSYKSMWKQTVLCASSCSVSMFGTKIAITASISPVSLSLQISHHKKSGASCCNCVYVLIFKGHKWGKICRCGMKKQMGGRRWRQRTCEGDRGGEAVVTPIMIENVKEIDVELNSCSIM